MKVRYTERALGDLEGGLAWYANISTSLGATFLEAIEGKLDLIKANPRSYQVSYKNYHSATLERFPFSLIYTIEIDSIVIHAVFDNRQSPVKKP